MFQTFVPIHPAVPRHPILRYRFKLYSIDTNSGIYFQKSTSHEMTRDESGQKFATFKYDTLLSHITYDIIYSFIYHW